MLFAILLTIQVIISVCMGGLILIQRSEGGALGMGGGPSGFMSARGAGNLLTRLTAVLATLFFVNCIGLTIAGNLETAKSSAVDRVNANDVTGKTATLTQAPAAAAASTSSAPSLSDLPIAGAPIAGSSSSTAAPATFGPAPASRPAASSSSAPLKMPPPLARPASSSASSPVPNIFGSSSSSARSTVSSPASKPASASSTPATSSTTSSPQ